MYLFIAHATRTLPDEVGSLLCLLTLRQKAHRVRSPATTCMSVAGVGALALSPLLVCRFCDSWTPSWGRFNMGPGMPDRLFILRLDHFVRGCAPPVMYNTYEGRITLRDTRHHGPRTCQPRCTLYHAHLPESTSVNIPPRCLAREG